MYAIIDIGSNTIRLNVYQVEEDGAIHSIFQSKETAGLAGYVQEDGSMSREGLDRAADALLRFRSILDALHIENRAVFATASLRNITNSEEAVFQLQERTGLMIRLLSGREEAILDYVGATSGMEEREQGMVLDIGGGSTEWVCFSQGRIRHAASIPLGSLNLYNRCVETLLPSPKEQAKIRKQVKKALDGAPLPDFPCPVICGVGGTIRGAGKLCNYLYKLPACNRTITLNMVDGLLERFSAPAKADLQILLKIVPERVHTLLPGLVILSTLAHRCRGDAIEVSSYGVREGFLLTEVLKRRSVTV